MKTPNFNLNIFGGDLSISNILSRPTDNPDDPSLANLLLEIGTPSKFLEARVGDREVTQGGRGNFHYVSGQFRAGRLLFRHSATREIIGALQFGMRDRENQVPEEAYNSARLNTFAVITGLYVHPDHRRQRIATTLINEFIRMHGRERVEVACFLSPDSAKLFGFEMK